MSEACTAGFSTCAQDPLGFMSGMSVLFAYGAEIAPKDLIDLARVLTLRELKGIFLGGLTFVDNPFIPGVRWVTSVLVCWFVCLFLFTLIFDLPTSTSLCSKAPLCVFCFFRFPFLLARGVSFRVYLRACAYERARPTTAPTLCHSTRGFQRTPF